VRVQGRWLVAAALSVFVLAAALFLDGGGSCDGVADSCRAEPLGDWSYATFWIVVVGAFVAFCVYRAFSRRR
jgi:hypothetical protein